MKKLLVLLIAFSPYIGYSQQYPRDYNDIAIATYEFELAHMDSITKYTSDTLITAVARFSPGGALHSVSYYKGLANYDNFDSDTIGPEVTVWPGFDAFIKNQYPFFPVSRYDVEYGKFDVITFVLHLNKDILPKAIALQKEQKEEQKRFLEQLYAEDPFVDVLPNATFTVNVKKLEINRRNQQPLQEVKGKLMYLDSGVVRLSTECYMIFKVLKTSENGSPVNYFEYKLFGVKNGQAELYIKENTYTVYDGRVSLTAKGIPERNDDEEAEYDEDTAGYEVEDTAETAPVSNAYLDFEINITFGEP